MLRAFLTLTLTAAAPLSLPPAADAFASRGVLTSQASLSSQAVLSSQAALRTAAPGSASKAESEPVEIATRDNLTLYATFFPPRKDGYRAPAALLVHGAGGARGELDSLASNLQRRGFAVLSIDLRGHGESRTDEIDWEELNEEDRERTWAYALRDLAAGATYLRGRDDVHTSNLSIVGVRSGSTLAARYANSDENARALVLVAPRPRDMGFDVAEDLNELGGLPTLILAAKGDRNSAERMQNAAHSANGGYEYVVVKALREECAEVLSDKRLFSELGSWLKDSVLPKKR